MEAQLMHKRAGDLVGILGIVVFVVAIVVLVVTIAVTGMLHTPRLINEAVEYSLASVVENVMPSVVHIQYESNEVNYLGQKIDWQGSGVIISKNGLVLTARHVCEKPGKFTVTLADDRKFVTEKACASRDYDVGYLKIDAKDLPAAKFGDSDEMRLGSRVLAIGSPWGKQHFNSVTLGIISAVGLAVDEQDKDWGWQVLFQTDVAANPGNSGGPVFNTNGEIVGIVVGLYGPGHYAGITFCVPSNICKKLVKTARLAFDLHNVMIVEANERVDKLEDWAGTVEDDIREIEKRLDNIGSEREQENWKYYWDHWLEEF